ncbi:ABC transporter permease subunit [Paenibacillus qinlingensis]|uniref:Aldouronate transport system permease protein n=1 Tax=Paenibacillus qinlingensis TaxID=1837343 RepID=A0ABU1NX12_9BACL|nr:ABC transporter permease subunit [Paenibacillus qinlingensis]MDR6552018.1 putative aldouronate transport system permease protein [Paenibacillus qinlingensis]
MWSTRKSIYSRWPLHLMLLPGLALLFVYHYIPMLGVSLAFQNFKPTLGLFGSKWVGWDNFTYMMALPNIYRVIWNTLYISVLKVIAGLAFPIIIALLLNEIRTVFVKRSIQTLIYLPHFLSWIILGGILIDVLSPSTGIVNGVLKGLGFEPVFFLGEPKTFPYVLVTTDVWKEFGFNTIVYLAAITGINPNLYEAAVVDGANRWKQILHITIPGILPVIVLLATLSLGHILNAGFDQVFNLYNKAVYETGDIIDTLVYRMGIQQAKYSLATAVGLFKSVVSFILISVSYMLAYRFANYRIF